MKILLIGHSVEDHLLYQGKEIIKPGGIYYSASALNYFKDNDDEISLCTSIEQENYPLFADVYDKLDTQLINKVEAVPKVYLTLHNERERDECYNDVTQNLIFKANDLSKYNGILINMITGYDITLDQLKEIRGRYNGTIYLDVHTLSRGLDNDKKRYFRLIPEFSEWALNTDIIQLNENELHTTGAYEQELDLVRNILNCGTKILIVTKGHIGSKIFTLNKGEIISTFIPSIKIEQHNKVGCGDVFGAIFFYSYIKNGNIFEALTLANIAGGYMALYDTQGKMKELKKDVLSRYY